MNIPIKRALISVTDKKLLELLVKGLAGRSVEIIASGGTAKAIREAGLAVVYLSPTLRERIEPASAGWYSVRDTFAPDRLDGIQPGSEESDVGVDGESRAEQAGHCAGAKDGDFH